MRTIIKCYKSFALITHFTRGNQCFLPHGSLLDSVRIRKGKRSLNFQCINSEFSRNFTEGNPSVIVEKGLRKWHGKVLSIDQSNVNLWTDHGVFLIRNFDSIIVNESGEINAKLEFDNDDQSEVQITYKCENITWESSIVENLTINENSQNYGDVLIELIAKLNNHTGNAINAEWYLLIGDVKENSYTPRAMSSQNYTMSLVSTPQKNPESSDFIPIPLGIFTLNDNYSLCYQSYMVPGKIVHYHELNSIGGMSRQKLNDSDVLKGLSYYTDFYLPSGKHELFVENNYYGDVMLSHKLPKEEVLILPRYSGSCQISENFSSITHEKTVYPKETTENYIPILPDTSIPGTFSINTGISPPMSPVSEKNLYSRVPFSTRVPGSPNIQQMEKSTRNTANDQTVFLVNSPEEGENEKTLEIESQMEIKNFDEHEILIIISYNLPELTKLKTSSVKYYSYRNNQIIWRFKLSELSEAHLDIKLLLETSS